MKIPSFRFDSTLTTIAAVFILVLSLTVIWHRAQFGEKSDRVAEKSPDIESGSDTFPNPSIANAVDGAIHVQRNKDSDQLSETKSRELNLTENPYPHEFMVWDYRRFMESEILSNPPRIPDKVDPEVDGYTAFRIHLFYEMCASIPRTRQKADSQLQDMADAVEGMNPEYLENLAQKADRLVNRYELCQRVSAKSNLRLESFKWLSTSALLGHEIAQITYYSQGIQMLSRYSAYEEGSFLVMLYPNLISEFKSTARFALSEALERGHPEAYMAMAEAVMDGIVLDRDPVLALAYLRSAEGDAARNVTMVRMFEMLMSDISEHLDPEEIAKAESLALQLRSD